MSLRRIRNRPLPTRMLTEAEAEAELGRAEAIMAECAAEAIAALAYPPASRDDVPAMRRELANLRETLAICKAMGEDALDRLKAVAPFMPREPEQAQ